LVLVAFMVVAVLAVARFMPRRAVTQHLAQSQLQAEATAELTRVIQVMVVLVVVAVTTILVNEFLSELSAREIQVVGQTAVVTELVVVVVVQVALAPMRLRSILEAPEALEFRR
jgi:hypothetical protein